MLRSCRLMGGFAAAALALALGACGQDSSPYHSVRASELPYVAAAQRLSGPVLEGESVVILKLGLGIAGCRRHVASIAVREDGEFRTVARALSFRDVGAANVGLMAARIEPGTYYIVHGRCMTRRRVYDVGRPIGRFRVWPQRLRTSYAKFEIGESQVVNAGFLQFSRRRGGGRAKIKLQSIPDDDLDFLAASEPRLRERLTLRLMRLTGPDGRLFARSRPAKRAAPVKPRSKPRKRRKRQAVKTLPKKPPPRPSRPAAPKPAAVKLPVGAKPKLPPPPVAKPAIVTPKPAASDSSITVEQREAACAALRKLKSEGKVQQLPITCLQLKLPRTALPPANGPGK